MSTRILHVLDSMTHGGIQAFVLNVYRHIDTDRYQFDFLLHKKLDNDYEREIISRGGKLYFVSERREGVIKNKKELDSFFSRHREYRIVHMHASSYSYIQPLVSAKKYGVEKIIIHAHSSTASGGLIHKIIHYYNKRNIQKLANVYLACSDVAQNWFYSGLSLDTQIVNNGIESERFRYDSLERERIRKDLCLKPEDIICIHIGSFCVAKNHKFLIDVFRHYCEDKAGVKLLLVGEGSLKNEITNYVNICGLKDKVLFLGYKKEISSYLSAADLFLMPSLYEGMPVSLIEAQANGILCVCSNTITETAVLSDRVSMLSITEGTPIWYSALNRITDFSHDEFGCESVKRFGFDINDTINKLVSIYR